jgi:hypothetical protein
LLTTLDLQGGHHGRITPCATSNASATRSMATVRRDAASVEVTKALHSDLGNSRAAGHIHFRANRTSSQHRRMTESGPEADMIN